MPRVAEFELDDGNAESYDFWGTWLRMTDLCNLARGLKQVKGALTAINIFKVRAREGRLFVDAVNASSGAASVPAEIWCQIQELLQDVARNSIHQHQWSNECPLGDNVIQNAIHTGGHRANGHQAWCSLCWPDYKNRDFSYIPRNALGPHEYPQQLKDRAAGLECNCKACAGKACHMMHLPGGKCPAVKGLEFERLILKPYGLRLACIVSIDRRAYHELCGVTLDSFPELVPTESSEAVTEASKSNSAGTQARNAGATTAQSESPIILGQRKRQAALARISKEKMKQLREPFRRLLSDYPSLIGVKGRDQDEDYDSLGDDEEDDCWIDDEWLGQDSPFHLCYHHTPVTRGQLGPEGLGLDFKARSGVDWPYDNDNEEEDDDEFGYEVTEQERRFFREVMGW